MNFYTYLWLREDGTPYYVGKGQGVRAFKHDRANARRPRSNNRIITQEWPDEASAFEAEKILIAYYGRADNGTGCLRNLTDGGEGASGCKQSPAANEKRSTASRRMWSNSDFKAKVKGRHASFLTPEHQAAAGRKGGSKHSEKQKANCRCIASLGGQAASASGQAGTIAHQRWHVKRGITSTECKLCK